MSPRTICNILEVLFLQITRNIYEGKSERCTFIPEMFRKYSVPTPATTGALHPRLSRLIFPHFPRYFKLSEMLPYTNCFDVSCRCTLTTADRATTSTHIAAKTAIFFTRPCWPSSRTAHWVAAAQTDTCQMAGTVSRVQLQRFRRRGSTSAQVVLSTQIARQQARRRAAVAATTASWARQKAFLRILGTLVRRVLQARILTFRPMSIRRLDTPRPFTTGALMIFLGLVRAARLLAAAPPKVGLLLTASACPDTCVSQTELHARTA